MGLQQLQQLFQLSAAGGQQVAALGVAGSGVPTSATFAAPANMAFMNANGTTTVYSIAGGAQSSAVPFIANVANTGGATAIALPVTPTPMMTSPPPTPMSDMPTDLSKKESSSSSLLASSPQINRAPAYHAKSGSHSGGGGSSMRIDNIALSLQNKAAAHSSSLARTPPTIMGSKMGSSCDMKYLPANGNTSASAGSKIMNSFASGGDKFFSDSYSGKKGMVAAIGLSTTQAASRSGSPADNGLDNGDTGSNAGMCLLCI
jgi:hypothetical protein